MSDKFQINAVAKLKPIKEKPWNTIDVPGIVGAEFAKDINSLYGEVLLKCIKELETSKLSLVSIKMMPVGDTMNITINVNLHVPQKINPDDEDEEPSTYRMVNLTQGSEQVKRLNLHRLVSFMKAKALQDHGEQFVSIMHLRIIRQEKDDFDASRF